jgi:hypothetical protein
MRTLNLFAAMTAAGLLVACGGSPSDSTPSTGGSTALTLSGVAAKGAALANANVQANCATGTGTATAGADGSYTLTITGGALPCVLEATGLGADAGLVLHSVATGSGSSATSNITPVTELLVAQLTGQSPADFMDAANATTLNSIVTTANIDAAKTEVIATLSAAGLDTTALGGADMVSGTLQAGTGAGYDGVLDALGSALTASGTTLAQLTTTVVNTASGGTSGTETAAPTSALPADLLLRPKASNCDALRSTSYRLIKLASTNGASDAPTTAVETMSFNAQTLTATFSADDTLTFTPNGTCRYILSEGEAVVSPSGVIVLRHLVGTDDDTVGSADRGVAHMMIGLPVQDLAVADLAGHYAFLGADRNPIVGYGGYATVTAAGAINNFSCWDDALSVAEASCTAIAADHSETLSRNSDGSFTWAGEDWSDTVFAYRAGNGETLILSLTDTGEPTFGIKRRTLSLPSVGQTINNWTILVDGNLVALPTISETSHAIVSADAGTGTVVRNTTENGTTVQQTLVYNSGRATYVSRQASTGVRPFDGLAMPGLGLTAIVFPSTVTAPANNARFALSVRQ